MADAVVAAGLEDVVEAHEVALDVGIGVGDAVAHACLCGEVDDDAWLVLLEDAVDGLLVGDVFLEECPVASEGCYLCEPFFLEAYVVVVGEGVDADDLDVLEFAEKAAYEVGADESGGTGDDDGLSFELYVVF